MKQKLNSKLLNRYLTAAPIGVPKNKYFYVVVRSDKLIKEIKKAKNQLILEGVSGVSSSTDIFGNFGGPRITMPRDRFLKYNKVEKIDYSNPDDIVKNSAQFLSRLQSGDLTEGDYRTIHPLITGSLNELYSVLGNETYGIYPFYGKNLDTLKGMLVHTKFDSINELVWFILMYMEREYKNWGNITNKDIDKFEILIKRYIKEVIKDVASSFRHEKEIVLLNNRLVVPSSSIINYSHEFKGLPDNLIEKLNSLGMVYEF